MSDTFWLKVAHCAIYIAAPKVISIRMSNKIFTSSLSSIQQSIKSNGNPSNLALQFDVKNLENLDQDTNGNYLLVGYPSTFQVVLHWINCGEFIIPLKVVQQFDQSQTIGLLQREFELWGVAKPPNLPNLVSNFYRR
jgi:hypothetical protein